MTTINITYSKVVTAVETDVLTDSGKIKYGSAKVVSFKTKDSFFKWVANKEALNAMVTSNINGFVSKMQALGFEVETSKKDCFDWETRVYCSK